MNNRSRFSSFLNSLNPPPHAQQLFDRYFHWLVAQNASVNLISRQTPPEDIWTRHLLDSLLAAPHIPCGGTQVLDFGTGGGLPGIPLKIVYPEAHMSFMDSRAKKVQAVANAVEELGLTGCAFLPIRLEQVPPDRYNRFEVIVCRAVRIQPRFARVLMKLLTTNGRLYLYKSSQLDDTEQFARKRIIDISHPVVGERRLVVVPRQ